MTSLHLTSGEVLTNKYFESQSISCLWAIYLAALLKVASWALKTPDWVLVVSSCDTDVPWGFIISPQSMIHSSDHITRKACIIISQLCNCRIYYFNFHPLWINLNYSVIEVYSSFHSSFHKAVYQLWSCLFPCHKHPQEYDGKWGRKLAHLRTCLLVRFMYKVSALWFQDTKEVAQQDEWMKNMKVIKQVLLGSSCKIPKICNSTF